MTSTKKKKAVDEWKEPPTPPSPKLPQAILDEFLKGNIDLPEGASLGQIKAGFLFDKNGIERYRIDVWASEPLPNMFTKRHYIANSWYVIYDQEKITDKTLGEYVDNKNKIKKLEGIADSNVRVGKSPW